MVKFDIKTDIARPVIDKRGVNINIMEEMEEVVEVTAGKKILEEMFVNYETATKTTEVPKGSDNWYHHCSAVLRKMSKEPKIINGNSDEERLENLKTFLTDHIVDMLMMQERVDLMNFLHQNQSFQGDNEEMQQFVSRVRLYLKNKEISARGITGTIIFNGPSRSSNLNVFVLRDGMWVQGEPEDKRDLQTAFSKYLLPKNKLNNYVGFIGFENIKKYMVYKIKDTTNERSTGFRCDQAGKVRVVDILNDIENEVTYSSKGTKEGMYELCVRQEFTLRSFQQRKLDDLIWFVNTETAIINEFEKKEKK